MVGIFKQKIEQQWDDKMSQNQNGRIILITQTTAASQDMQTVDVPQPHCTP